MNFEEAYKKYKDGSADDKEKAFVEAEIEKARKISALLDSETDEENNHDDELLEEADSELIKKAKKAFMKKTTLRTIIIVVLSIVVIAGLVAGVIFGTAYYFASSNTEITEDEATEIGMECMAEYVGTNEGIVVRSVERELEPELKLNDSIFVYDLHIQFEDRQYKIEVSSVSGYAKVVDIGRKPDKPDIPESPAIGEDCETDEKCKN